ncbi:MAG: CBS domain-containing protein [Patescibacteria group bacterium]|nr:CBS domain-containing protein [Patescibacteria group bacterium]
MKVKDLMQKNVVYVSPKTKLQEVARLIFGYGINGLPVCEKKKLLGMITERDIISQFFPTMQEFVEDPFRSSDFEKMEGKTNEILSYSADKIMSTNPTTVSPETPILEAQSTMQIHKVGRLPVIDKTGNLIGILSKGDIFRGIIKGKLFFAAEEEFYDWLAKYYDVLIDWKKRLSVEIPDLVDLFKKEKVGKILDLAYGTGEHAIELAKKGFEVVGLEASSTMHKISEGKREKINKDAAKRVKFLSGIYKDMVSKLPRDFDAVTILGNSMPFIAITDKEILKRLVKVLNPEKSLLVLQIVNFEKILTKQGGVRDFTRREAGGYDKEYAFLGFYSKNKEKALNYTRAVFDFDGKRWGFKGMTSTQIKYIGQREIEAMLKKIGFSKIEFYGSPFYGSLLGGPFKPDESDWLNVVAKR